MQAHDIMQANITELTEDLSTTTDSKANFLAAAQAAYQADSSPVEAAGSSDCPHHSVACQGPHAMSDGRHVHHALSSMLYA